MKAPLLLVPLLFSGFCISPLNAAESPPQTSKATSDPVLPILTEIFMERAEEINLAEINLAKLAKAKGKGDQVKKLADRLLTDHQANSQELKKLAAEKNVVLPIETNQKMRDQALSLEKLEGEIFDANFLANQKNGHGKSIALYQEAAKSSDREIQAFATKHLAMLKEHHQLAGGHAGTSENPPAVPTDIRAVGGPTGPESTGTSSKDVNVGSPTTPGNTGGGTGAPRGGQ